MSRITTAVVVLLAALVVAILAVTAAPGAGKPKYLDSTRAIAARVNDLLHRMTLAEKVGQMDQQLVDNLTGPSSGLRQPGLGQLNPDCLKTWLVDNNVGSLLAGGTDNPPDTTGVRRHRQHRLRLGQRVQHDPEVRDPELAAAPSGDFRR